MNAKKQKTTTSGQPPHVAWFANTGAKIQTQDGKAAVIWEFRHEPDDSVLSLWAKHFREHYCKDSEIDALRNGTGHSRSEYLTNLIFPDHKKPPGPSIRAGDFGEILVADYLEFLLKYWVPRTGYAVKAVRNESTKGSDVIGFKTSKKGESSPSDTLAIFEVKSQFTGSKSLAKLQEAVEGSAKDALRKAETLNAIKRRLIQSNRTKEAERVERFQNPPDHPYREVFGAVAVLTTPLYEDSEIKKTKTKHHPNFKGLELLVIRGESMMELVHLLYKKAALEA